MSDVVKTQNVVGNELPLWTQLRHLESLPQTLQTIVDHLLALPDIIELITSEFLSLCICLYRIKTQMPMISRANS